MIRVVAHTLGAVGPNTSDNHWSIYMLLDNNASELRITAELSTDKLRHSTFRFPNCWWCSGCRLTVIYQNHRDVYEMSRGGSGCRYWV